jgi:GNAT superfamily N-acetyltransferase
MHVALLTPAQHEPMVDLLCELHAHYNAAATIDRAVVRAHLVSNLLAAASPVRFAVAARDGGAVCGLAAFVLMHSVVEHTPEKSHQCALKELFVREHERSRGVGHALMAWVARHALENGCSRIDWPVNAANPRGIAFYEGLGAERVAERLSYRLSGDSLQRLARGKTLS